MTNMVAALLACLLASTVACSGGIARDRDNGDHGSATAGSVSRPLQLGGNNDQGVHGLRPAIHDGVNGPCSGVCGEGIKPSPNVWTH